MQVERSIIIRCPVPEVFAFLSNVENAVKWQETTVETHQTMPGPMRVGARLAHVGKFLGRRIENTGEVYEYEPDKSFAYRTLEGVSTDIRYRFEPVPEGTRFTLIYGGQPGNLFKLAEPLVVRATARLLEGDLNKLKRVMEGEAA